MSELKFASNFFFKRAGATWGHSLRNPALSAALSLFGPFQSHLVFRLLARAKAY
jgi:hypothetical protein